MGIFLLGISHDDTPINIREKVHFSENKKISTLLDLKDMDINSIILSTCNRCEIYISSDDMKSDINILKSYFFNTFKIDNLKIYIYEKEDDDAIEHIYSVCSGMKSAILGEDQILGQVKDALINSQELDCSDKLLNKIFKEAITTAKKIKTELKISDMPLSLSYIAVKMLRENIENLKEKKILVLGTGTMGRLCITHLASCGCKNIYCSNRNIEKIRDIMEKYPFIKHYHYDDRYSIIYDMDILITSTASPHIIVDSNKLYITKKLTMIDLSLPRDIDENVKENINVTLYDIDDLKKISTQNMNTRKILSTKAMAMIKSSMKELKIWQKSVAVDTIIKSLNEKCDIIYEDTMDYINRKITLNSREKKIVEKMLYSAIKRVIKEPILTLKNIEKDRQKEYIDITNDLFDIKNK